jgi:hypothetical protein
MEWFSSRAAHVGFVVDAMVPRQGFQHLGFRLLIIILPKLCTYLSLGAGTIGLSEATARRNCLTPLLRLKESIRSVLDVCVEYESFHCWVDSMSVLLVMWCFFYFPASWPLWSQNIFPVLGIFSNISFYTSHRTRNQVSRPKMIHLISMLYFHEVNTTNAWWWGLLILFCSLIMRHGQNLPYCMLISRRTNFLLNWEIFMELTVKYRPTARQRIGKHIPAEEHART